MDRQMNQETRLRSLKFVLALISVYHIALGVVPFMSPDLAVQVSSSVFGMTLVVTPQLLYIAKLLGIYAFIFGIVVLLVAKNPEKHRGLIYVIVLLYAARIINRIMFIHGFMEAFQTTAFRAWSDVVLLAVFAAAVILLRPLARPAG
ncbi:MAG: hypothetical protein ABSG53_10025 [Thermoguttaceae bacterium]|jgi:hypothetical protein